MLSITNTVQDTSPFTTIKFASNKQDPLTIKAFKLF